MLISPGHLTCCQSHGHQIFRCRKGGDPGSAPCRASVFSLAEMLHKNVRIDFVWDRTFCL